MAAAVEHVRTVKPTLTFVHLDHVDHAGHRIGWFTPAYFEEVRVADELIGDMLGSGRYSLVAPVFLSYSAAAARQR